ncbi:pilus assembly protein PilM, partial [bacterium]|nr:pilus assembly protein PilM [bacterium]
RNGALISILPREFVTVKRFTLPSADHDKIEQIVRFEAEKYVPFSVDRSVMDFDFVPISSGAAEAVPEEIEGTAEKKAAEGDVLHSMVTLAAVRQGVIPRFIELHSFKHFKQHAIDVSSFGLYNAFAYYLRQKPLEPGGGDALVISIGARWTDLIVVSAASGELLWSRSIEYGGAKLTEKIAELDKISFEDAERRKCDDWGATSLASSPAQFEEALAPLIEQIEKSVRYIHSSGISKSFSAVWLCGGSANTPGLPELFGGKLGVPAELFDPLAMLNVKGVKAPATSFGILVGAALRIVRATTLSINLLPVDIALLQQQQVRMRRFIQLGVAAAVVLVALMSIFGARVAWAAYQRRQIQQDVERAMPLAVMVDRLEKQNEDLRRAVMEMEQLTDTKTSWSKVLNTVSECMNSASGERNSNVWVQRVMVDKRNRMQITGRSVRTEDYILFKNNMANSKRFQNVEVIDSRKEPDGLSFSFVLTCDVLPDYKFIEALKRVQRMIEPAPARAAEPAPPAPPVPAALMAPAAPLPTNLVIVRPPVERTPATAGPARPIEVPRPADAAPPPRTAPPVQAARALPPPGATNVPVHLNMPPGMTNLLSLEAIARTNPAAAVNIFTSTFQRTLPVPGEAPAEDGEDR